MNSNAINELSVRINNKDLPIRLQGTSDCPYFCGKDICTVLDYANVKDVLQKLVEPNDKQTLKNLNDITDKRGGMLGTHIPNLYHNDGRAVYINEKGLYSLLNSSRSSHKVQLRAFIDQFLYDLR
jgi:prophage antirepressor-like protein